MNESRKKTTNFILKSLKFLSIPLALVVVVLLVRTRSGPESSHLGEVSKPLRVISAPAVSFVPVAKGYGTVEPKRIWNAVAEVKGTIVFVHPELESGAIVKEDTVLLKIDPVDYQLVVAKLNAQIAEINATIQQLKVEEENGKESLAIELKSIEFARKSLARVQSLREKDITTEDTLDREERNVLRQQQTIQQIKNTLALVPSKLEAFNATLKVAEANLEQAQRDLVRTVIKAPFDCRIGAVHLEVGEFLAVGQQLFEAHGTDYVEIESLFRPDQMRNLLSIDKRKKLEQAINMESLRDVFDLSVIVRLTSNDWMATWSAEFDRIREVVDPRMRAISVIATVKNPYEKIVPGIRPALVLGMYCEVELRAPIIPETIVIPRSAVWDGGVYVVGSNNRLEKVEVDITLMQGNLAVVGSGLKKGQMVVVSDPSPAIEGMMVEPVPDSELLKRIVLEAEGQE